MVWKFGIRRIIIMGGRLFRSFLKLVGAPRLRKNGKIIGIESEGDFYTFFIVFGFLRILQRLSLSMYESIIIIICIAGVNINVKVLIFFNLNERDARSNLIGIKVSLMT